VVRRSTLELVAFACVVTWGAAGLVIFLPLAAYFDPAVVFFVWVAPVAAGLAGVLAALVVVVWAAVLAEISEGRR